MEAEAIFIIYFFLFIFIRRPTGLIIVTSCWSSPKYNSQTDLLVLELLYLLLL